MNFRSPPRRVSSSMLWATMALVSLVGMPAAATASPQEGKVVCKACHSTGGHPCKKHRKQLDLEKDVKFCSVATACKVCEGTYTVDCKICKNTEAEAAAETRREQVRAWRKDRHDKIEAFTKAKTVLHGQTAHFDLTFTIEPMKIGKRKPSQHELMHIWLARLEALYAEFCKTFELTDKDFVVRSEIYMFEKQADHKVMVPRTVGSAPGDATGKKYMGDKMIFSMWRQPKELRDDEDLHRFMNHNVTHLFINHMAPHTWIFNKGHGWIDAGIAHWFEYKASDIAANYCYEEVVLDPGTTWKGGKWRVPIRLLVDSGKVGLFRDLYKLNTDQLTLEAHALAFAYVDFLISAHGGAKMRDLIRLVKDKVETRDALQKVYGLTPLTIENKFREWVKKTYPRRERPGRRR